MFLQSLEKSWLYSCRPEEFFLIFIRFEEDPVSFQKNWAGRFLMHANKVI